MKAPRKGEKGISFVVAFIGIALIIICLVLAGYFAPTGYWVVAIFFAFLAVAIFGVLVRARED